MSNKQYTGAIEAGGTKFVCAIIDNKRNIIESTRIATAHPSQTLTAVVDFFNEMTQRSYKIERLGLGCFGPLDLNPKSSSYGSVTSTPKKGWQNIAIKPYLEKALGLSVFIDTDVNAAALAESMWGASANTDVSVYITIGTGIGGGLVINGKTVKGLVHPEMGHMRIKTPHNIQGQCPYHKDCVEGLASGTSLQGIWKTKAEDLPEGHPAWDLQAHVVAQLCNNLLMTVSPQRIVMGGGVMQQDFLLKQVVSETEKLVNKYIVMPTGIDCSDIIVHPGLGTLSGLLGAYALTL